MKCINLDDVQYLATTLRQLYEITKDWSGSKYLGITIEHNYEAKELAISLPNYVAKMLQKYHIDPNGPCTYLPAPYQFVPNGPNSNKNHHIDESVINDERQQFIRQVVGSVIYYARVIDSTMLCDTTRLGSQGSNPSLTTKRNTYHLLNYVATYPVVRVIFRASDMILRISSDASYASETGSRSRAGGYFDLIRTQDNPITAPINGAIHVVSSILNVVVASYVEAEYGDSF